MWKCHKCGKPVFFAERKQSLGYDWHPECLRCEECGKRVNPGQHAEHKGVPYCHVPCYGALFGPQLFGHGTRVESHKSFGQKGSPNAQHLQRAQLESKLKEYNQYFDKKSGEVRSREVNGRLILEGSLRIYWGVQGLIHLKENDDQRTVVTVRKRNSVRVDSDSESDEDTFADLIPRDDRCDELLSPSASEGTDNAIATDSPEHLSRPKSDLGNDTTDSTWTESNCSPVTESKCQTLPMKLEKEAEWDELDDLLQVERKVDENAKLYQTMPSPLPSQSSIESTSSDSTSTEKNCVLTETSTLRSVPSTLKDYANISTTDTDATLKYDGTLPPALADCASPWNYDDTISGNHLNRSMSGPDCLQRRATTASPPSADNEISNSIIPTSISTSEMLDQKNLMETSTTSCDFSTSTEFDHDDEVQLRPKKTGSTAIKRRPGKRLSRSKIKRRCSINGHFYDRETSFFTPPYGSQMSVWVSSLVNSQEVVNLILEKYKVDNNARNFALFVVRDNGEQKRLKVDDYPLMVRVMLGPHEEVSRLFMMDIHSTPEVSNEVAQFLNLSLAECQAILNQYCFQEDREVSKIKDKYKEIRWQIQQRLMLCK